jgi:hypothetical protein
MLKRARDDVKFLLDYEIKDSCDEKLLKLVANRSTRPGEDEPPNGLLAQVDTERGENATPRDSE